jgi:hypothetical protein
MVNTSKDATANQTASLPAWPVLSPAERDAVVARARVELFRLLPNVSEADWPFLEMGLQVRINTAPELQRRFWSEPEKVIVEALQDFAKWAETNETWQQLTGETKNA